MDSALETKVTEWLSLDRNAATRAEIKQLVDRQNYSALSSALLTRMEFGTAGLRAAMGAGFARMNDLTVIQTSQGIADYLQANKSSNDVSNNGIIIGYDARHNSRRFAERCANVFLAAGFKTRLFGQICPTPFVPSAVKQYGCVAGVMITASHNPKQDNGYKLYWDNGAQIIPPHDTNICAAISKCTILDSAWGENPIEAGAIDVYDEVFTHYFSSLKQEVKHFALNQASQLKFTYTAMHGVGTAFTVECMKTFGFTEANNIVLVKQQVEPDPDFPTVEFPNPEEGESSLNLSMEAASEAGSTIILANDPDADRLAVAERLPDGGWKVFTGNELGALFGWWLCYCYKYGEGEAPRDMSNCYLLASTVSSRILHSIAMQEGLHFEDTLTGFKWMGSRSEQLVKEGKTVLFAFEEAIGYMCGTRVFDKDGVTAAGVMAEMATWLQAKEQRTLVEQLEYVYATYGSHISYNSYVISKDSLKTRQMFEQIRNGGKYCKRVAGVEVLSIRDLGTGLDTARPDHQALLPLSISSPMITFHLKNCVTLTIRSSGTEPKIKWYSEIISNDANAREILVEMVDTAVQELMRPNHFGFEMRKFRKK